MSETVSIILPTHYTVREYHIRGTADKIREQILNRKFRHILGVQKLDDGNAALFYKCAVCPHCGKRHLLRTVPLENGYPSKTTVENWATGQTAFFSDYRITSLRLARDVILPDVLTCKNCGKTSEKGDHEHRIGISSHRGKISISFSFDNIFELFKLADYSVMTLGAPFVYNQVITFNLHNGHTFFSICDQEGKAVYTRDITICDDDLFLEGDLPGIICLPQVRKEIRRKFEKYGSLAFPDKELNYETLILATRFVGYPRDFYRKIPFSIGTKKIHPDLRHAARLIRNAKNLPKAYDISGLPKCKSIRREIFAEPALMFYFREIKKLCDIVGNVDYMSTVLTHGRMYLLLARLTVYPEVFGYFSDCVKAGKMRKVIRAILAPLCTMDAFIGDGIRYAAMSGSAKRYILNLPSHTERCDLLMLTDILPSHPIHKPYSDLSTGKFAGYDFEWLITTDDYHRAGKIMKNCLANYDEPVMIMKKGGKYIAAFSLISRDVIGQAHLCENENLCRDENACNALRRWAEKNKVAFRIPSYDGYDEFFDEEYA